MSAMAVSHPHLEGVPILMRTSPRTQTISPGLGGGLNPGSRPSRPDSDHCPTAVFRTLTGSESRTQTHTYVGGLNPDRAQPCPWREPAITNGEVAE